MALSFGSNTTTLLLVGYKTWCVVFGHAEIHFRLTCDTAYRLHRRLVKENLGKSAASSQALRVLGLLVESGAIYSAFWVSSIVDTRILSGTILIYSHYS